MLRRIPLNPLNKYKASDISSGAFLDSTDIIKVIIERMEELP